MKTVFAVLLVVGLVGAENMKTEKRQEKRGLVGGQFGYGTHSSYQGGFEDTGNEGPSGGLGGSQEGGFGLGGGQVTTVTLTREIPVPYLVALERRVPVPVPVPHPVPVLIERHVPYPVGVPVPQPYPVERTVPVPVHVPVEKPYPVVVTRTVQVPVERQVASIQYHVPYSVPVNTHSHGASQVGGSSDSAGVPSTGHSHGHTFGTDGEFVSQH